MVFMSYSNTLQADDTMMALGPQDYQNRGGGLRPGAER